LGPETTFWRRIKEENEFREFLREAQLHSKRFVVKPNWISPHPGNFTDAEILAWLLRSLDGEKVVIEGYSCNRNDGTKSITPKNDRINWSWIKKQDELFLEKTGINTVLSETDTSYVNVTEEVWQGRIVSPENTRKIVEAKYAAVRREELYSSVPSILYEMRGSTLISFARIKGVKGNFPSLSLKNMFGLIPDPARDRWHGRRDCKLSQSIVDINKVYGALFNVVGLNEGVRSAVHSHQNGRYETPWGRYDLVENLGVVVFGNSLVDLDAVTCGLIGVEPDSVLYLRLASEVFGKWDKKEVEVAFSNCSVLLQLD